MRCIDDESWDALKRHTAEHLRSRVWLGGARSVVSATAPVRHTADDQLWDSPGSRTIVLRACDL